MSRRKVVRRRRNRLAIEPLEPRRLLDVTGIWQELGFRSASGGGITHQPYWLDNTFVKFEGPTDNTSGNHSMAIDSRGRPFIAHDRDDLHPGTPGWVSVYMFNGFRWIPVGEDGLTVGIGSESAIALDFQGRPYVTWTYALDGEEHSDIALRYFDGQSWQQLGGSWTGKGLSDDPVKNREPDIAIGADGLPIVAYTAYDETGQDMEIVVKKFDGTRWVELTNGLPFGSTQGVLANLYGGGVSNDIYDSKNPSITVDRSGHPILAWTSETFANNSEIYIRRWTGSEWVEIGPDSASGPPGKFGPPDEHPSFGISFDVNDPTQSDGTMSFEPVVRVDNQNTIVVAWMDYWDFSQGERAGIYVKKYEQGAPSPQWVEYSPGSATGHGIVDRDYMTFDNISMEIGPHPTDPDGLWTPAIAWASDVDFLTITGNFQWQEGFLARFNAGNDTWEYLVGDGEDAPGGPYMTDPIDGPTPWAYFDTFPAPKPTPDVTGWRGYNMIRPGVGIDPNTGHEIITYANRDIWFPDYELYLQQYRSNTDYYEIRDLDDASTVDISVAWASAPGTPTGDLTISVLNGDGAPIQLSSGGQITEVTPTDYVDPVGGDTRGLVRLRIEGETWGPQNYILTIDQGGATQNVNEQEPNDVYLKRHVITSGVGESARTVVISGSINNEWKELGRGSLSRGGVDDSPTVSLPPRLATSYDGKPMMVYIDSNKQRLDDISPYDVWMEVKIFEEEARDEYGRPGAWVNLVDNAPLMSGVIDGALAFGANEFIEYNPGSRLLENPVTKVLDISADPWILNDLDGSVFIAVTDGDYIDVYETQYDPSTGSYSDLTLLNGTHAVTAPVGGKIVWVSIQSGPDGEAALAWEWFNKNGYPAGLTTFPMPNLGAGDVYAMLWDGSNWQDMEAGSASAPNYRGVGGLTEDGWSRWPDLAFVPTPSDPPPWGPGAENKGGSYVLGWSYGSWDPTAGEPDPPADPEPRNNSGFQSFGIKSSWFDKNTDTWVRDPSTSDFPVVDDAGPYTLYTEGKEDVVGTYQAQRKWPSVTIGESGRPFMAWTLELYSEEVQDLDADDPRAGRYYYLGSWIEGWQQSFFQFSGLHWAPVAGGKWEVGSSVSHSGIENERAGGTERVDDVLMATAVGNAGQAPIVTWQVLDIDVTDTQPDPNRTYIPHLRDFMTLFEMDLTGEDTFYDIWRPKGEAGWLYSAEDQRQIFARRFNEGGPDAGWEQMNSRSPFEEVGEFTSASGDGYHGVDQWWSSGFWPDMALTTDPNGFDVNELVIGWLNNSEQTVYVRGWHHESNLPLLTVLENSGTPNDDVLELQEVMVGSASAWTPVTLANNGTADLEILRFNFNAPFEILLTPEHEQQLAQGAITLGRGEQMVFHVRFAPGAEDAGQFYDVMEVVSTDPMVSVYPIVMYGVASTGATIVINENEGIEDDMVLPFGYVEPGDQKSLTLTISNHPLATGTLNVEGIFSGLPAIFEVDASLLSPLEPGQSATVTVTFKPPAGEAAMPTYDTLAVYSNDVINPRRFLRLVGNAPALFNLDQATDTPGVSEVNPTISGEYVAYVRTADFTEEGQPEGAIYLYDRAAGTESAGPIGTGSDPQIWGDWVIFTGGLYHIDDLDTGTFYSFGDMPGLPSTSISQVSVSQNRFALSFLDPGQPPIVAEIDRDKLLTDGVWGDSVGPGNVVTRIFQIPEVIPGAVNDHAALSGNWIAWRAAPTDTTREATDKAVFLYEYGADSPLLPVQLTPVAGAPGHMIPEFDNQRVVWMDDRWGAANPQIFMYDVSSQTGYQLTDSLSDKAAGFAYDGSLIVWADDRDGDWDLYAFDLAQWERYPDLAREAQLTFDDFAQLNPAVSGAWIAFQDDRPGRDQWDVYYGQFPGPPEIGVREISGEMNDDAVDFGDVNVGVTGGVGLELHNVGYDDLEIYSYDLNNLVGEAITVYYYDDTNGNYQWDAGEVRTVWDEGAGNPLAPLGVGDHHSIWIEWTPGSVGSLPVDAGMTITSNADSKPSYDISIAGRGVHTADMVIVPDPLDFGDVPVGTSSFVAVTITNQGNVALVLTDIVPSNPYFEIRNIVGDLTVDPGGVDSYSFEVWFDASLGGSYSGEKILIYNNDPDFAETGYYELSILAEAVDTPDIAVTDSGGTDLTVLPFGPVEVGRYDDFTLYIRNEGQAPLELTGWDSSDTDVIFLVDGLPTDPIAPGGSVSITVRFMPAEAISYAGGWFELFSNDPDVPGNAWGAPTENPYRLDLDAAAAGVNVPHITIEETVGVTNDGRIDFGTFEVAAGVQEHEFVVRNSGTDDLVVSGWTLTGAGAFSVVGLPDNFTLAPGAGMTGVVTFATDSPGTFAATLSIVSNDPDPGASPSDLRFTGRVISGQLVVNPGELDFGQIERGQSSAPQEFWIVNSGQAPLRVTGVVSTDPAFSITAPAGYAGAFDLPAGQTTPAFTVTFSPTAAANYVAAVRITSDDPENPIVEAPTLNGEGIELPDLIVEEPVGTPSDKQMAFGDVEVGQSSSQTIRLANGGTGVLRLSRWTSDNAVYTILPTNEEDVGDDIVLAPGGSVDLTVTFMPAAATTYPRAYPGTITIYSNDPNEPAFRITLSGQGTAPPVPGDFNGDGRLDLSDFGLFQDAFGSSQGDPNYAETFDLDGDGDVDFADLGILLGYFDQQMQAPAKIVVSPYVNLPEATPAAKAGGASSKVVSSGDNGKLAASGKVVGETGRLDGQVMLFENLGVAFDIGALPDEVSGIGVDSQTDGVSRAAAIETNETDDQGPAPVVQAAEVGSSGQVVRSETTGQAVSLGGLAQLTAGSSATPLAEAIGVRSAPLDELGLADLGELDPLVAPYASALLAPTRS